MCDVDVGPCDRQRWGHPGVRGNPGIWGGTPVSEPEAHPRGVRVGFLPPCGSVLGALRRAGGAGGTPESPREDPCVWGRGTRLTEGTPQGEGGEGEWAPVRTPASTSLTLGVASGAGRAGGAGRLPRCQPAGPPPGPRPPARPGTGPAWAAPRPEPRWGPGCRRPSWGATWRSRWRRSARHLPTAAPWPTGDASRAPS